MWTFYGNILYPNILSLFTTIVLFLTTVIVHVHNNSDHSFNCRPTRDILFKVKNIQYGSCSKMDYFKLVHNSQIIKPSSLWCMNDGALEENIENRYCRFESLCLKMDTNEYIFLMDPQYSIIYPPSLRNFTNQKSYGQLSSVVDHNRFEFQHFVTVPHGKTDKLKRTMYYIPGHTLIMTRFKPNNLMHLLHDDVVPLFATLKERNLVDRLNYVFFDDEWNENDGKIFLKSVHKLLLYKQNFAINSLLCFENAHIGLSKSTLWYQYGFKTPQNPIKRSLEEIQYIRNILRIFRNNVISSFNLNDKCLDKKSLLIARNQNRKIMNLSQFYRYLQQKFSNLNLIVFEKQIFNQRESLKSLLQMVICSQTLVSMHGSEQILSMLMNPKMNVQIIELFPYGINSSLYTPYRTLSKILGHHYFSWTNSIRENAHFHSDDYPPEWGGLAGLTLDDRKIMENIDSPLQAHLCCQDPNWLYRIYQDTTVDIQDFDKHLLKSLGDQTSDRWNVSYNDVYRLSEVENLTCSIENRSRCIISWKTPWNMMFLHDVNNITVSYEVLIQKLDANEGIVFETRSTSFVIDRSNKFLDCNLVGCHIWLRVKSIDDDTDVNGISGTKIISFYNRFPIYCILF